MTMMKISAKYVLGYNRGKMIHRRSVYITGVKQIVTKANEMENNGTKRHQADLDLFRRS